MTFDLTLTCAASNFSSSIPSSYNFYCQMHECITSSDNFFSVVVISSLNFVLILPLSVYVLFLGWRRWRSSGAPPSHADMFTYHMAVMDLLYVLGCSFICFGSHTNISAMEVVGVWLYFGTTPGQMFFHTLTCVERYLAVVHPITYLRLRKTSGVTIRNVAIGAVWLLSLTWMNFVLLDTFTCSAITFTVTGSTFAVVSFCCFSVVCVLNRPGPADRAGDRQHVDRSKRRALHTINAIMGALMLRFGGSIVSAALYPMMLELDKVCVLWQIVFWCCLPSGLVLPLLCLHREGKLACCQRHAD